MIPVTNVITVTVANTGTGLGEFNVNNIALFTTEPFLVDPDDDAWRSYKSAEAVGSDIGMASECYAQAVAIFSQQPNILAGGGELIIIPLAYGEDLITAIARAKLLVSFCGILSTTYPSGSDRKTLADAVQAYGDKIIAIPSNVYSDVAGVFTDIKNASDKRARCFLNTTSALAARLMAAATFGRGFSVDFNGSNTALTLNLKQLIGIDPDEGITQTYYDACAVAGVDVYVDYDGRASYVSNGANGFFDDVYNQIWLVSELRVVGFNTLALVSNKIPQTEPGMSLIKGAFRKVMEQAVRAGYIAPGQWNGAEWFGNQADMINNVLERGYYIYSEPVNLQAQAVREERIAPTIKIAAKLAGAIQFIAVFVVENA